LIFVNRAPVIWYSKRQNTVEGILIFVNRAPIIWYSKRQNTVEVGTFGSEITAMKNAIELIEALWYKLRLFGEPIDSATNFRGGDEELFRSYVHIEEA